MSDEFPGWETSKFGTMTLTVTVAGEQIRLATVTYERSGTRGARRQEREQ